MKIKDIKLKTGLIILFSAVIIGPVAWLLLVRLEGGKPSIILEPVPISLGASQELTITAADIKSGLRNVWVGLLKDGKDFILFKKNYPAPGITGSPKVLKESFKILIEPKKLGITDGKAILRMAAGDYSWRNWLHGNRIYIEKDVIIDTRPPRIKLLTRSHNIAQGGAGLIIYSLSEPCPQSGIYMGDNFFPGYSGHFSDKKIHMAFVGLNYTQKPGLQIYIEAVDAAGNSAKAGFSHYIRKRSFKRDAIVISDSFLNWKMPEFDIDVSNDAKISLIDKFLKVNRDFRQASYMQIVKQAEKTEKTLLWNGKFLRLPNSARKASFADHRAYKYKDRLIDRQVHLGMDLASVAHSPVPAANSGKVAFVGDISIYGITVIIDHGFGLFSMYSHLNSTEVVRGDVIQKGKIIGQTGTTGLAGGDHLHFGILIHNTFVNPVEWWDAVWIKNNIINKIKSVESRLGEE
ncbi:M23 family metallopeptidase [Thermodesulfobacteriota bacterium]